jgi:hypothetical protein
MKERLAKWLDGYFKAFASDYSTPNRKTKRARLSKKGKAK